MKILFVTYNMPLPRSAGSSQRTALLIGALQESHDVDLFLLRGRTQAEFLEENGYSVAGFAPLPELPAWRKALMRLLTHIRQEYRRDPAIFGSLKQVFDSGGYDVVVGRYLRASEVAGVGSLYPSIVDLDDLDTSVLANRLKAPGTPWWQKPFIKWKLRQLRSEFVVWLSRYTRCWVPSVNDRSLIVRNGVDVVPNISWQTTERPPYKPSGDAQTILWVGSFNHAVNLSGLDGFIERVWPEVHQKVRTARLSVVGSSLPERQRVKWSETPGVDVIGYVENLDEVYADAAISVVPLWDGAGTKIKVIESLSYGRTALVTNHAARGFEESLRHDESLWVVHNEEEMVRGALMLLAHVGKRQALEQNGRQAVELYHSRSALQQRVDEAMAAVESLRV